MRFPEDTIYGEKEFLKTRILASVQERKKKKKTVKNVQLVESSHY